MNLIEKHERIDELMNEVRMSLPNRRLLEVVNIGVIEIFGGVVVLKSRFEAHETKRLVTEELDTFVSYERKTERYEFNLDVTELHSKNVSFSFRILTQRGFDALIELIELAEIIDGGVVE